MLHKIDSGKIGPFGEPMEEAVRSCVHCGFCLAACPTYGELGQELDTPRGRIVLMKEVLEGGVEMEEALPHLDACLGCLACEPACPSGVQYRNLISPFRALAEDERSRPFLEKVRRRLVSLTLPYPNRFRVAARMAKLARSFAGGILPKAMRPMMDLLPPSLPPGQKLQERYEAQGERRATVALLAGCAQQVLDMFRHGSSSLAVPTWFYGHEPSNLFSVHIAKYFSNSLREDGLLAIALHGVIFAPGSAGTTQEVFQDATQNHYATYGVISPMVFLGRQHFGEKTLIYDCLRRQAEGKDYGDYLCLAENEDEVVEFITSNPPGNQNGKKGG